MTRLPPLDAHAHISGSISREDVAELSGVIFAMTRSLAEAKAAAARGDESVIWAVGCHPGLADAQRAFSVAEFRRLIESSAIVGEVGLDGTNASSVEKQRVVLREILGVLSDSPRLVSLHSTRAHRQLLDDLEQIPVRGAILHWWLGSQSLTRRAVAMGCYFSVNAAMVQHPETLDLIPTDRLLTETDHPYGDRRGPAPRLPGEVSAVEAALGRRLALDPGDVRRLVWRNLRQAVADTGVSSLLPRRVRSHLIVVE